MPGGGKALLFEHVLLRDGRGPRTRRDQPVRLDAAHGARARRRRLDEHGDRITQLLDLKVPEGLLGKLSMVPGCSRCRSSRRA
jgi:4-hydroxy-3-polyprenylbenzoate decarboxylase